MSDRVSFLTKAIGTLSAAGLLLLGILNTSAFSDAQKSFAGSVVLLILVLLYTEATYERKATKRDVKGKKSKAVDEGDNHDE